MGGFPHLQILMLGGDGLHSPRELSGSIVKRLNLILGGGISRDRRKLNLLVVAVSQLGVELKDKLNKR